MSDDHGAEPTPKTQRTQPKEGEPIEIPVPKEDDFEKLVRRAVGHAVPQRPGDKAADHDAR
jgi:hypothetical protein